MPIADSTIRQGIVPAAPGFTIRALLAAIAVLAIIGPLLVVRYGPVVVPDRAGPHLIARVIPPTVIPPVDPVRYEDISAKDAQAINAAIPFTNDPVPPAHPFRLIDAPIDAARAVDCLAAAQLYEAGDDAAGQRAVAQVILNRLRHPAFPKSICGVVFQGAERRTGCQFSFTCDGTMARFSWRPDQWARARLIATAALSGSVYTKVGYATHYHTVAVVPYWSASLDKVGAQGTHLFFRWTGWWGTPAAFNRRVDHREPVIAALAPFSPAHRADASLADILSPEQSAAMMNAAIASLPPPIATDPNTFLVTIQPGLPADELPRLAVQSCGARPYCKFMAWTDARQTPKRIPLDPGDVASLAFSYLRDHDRQFDKMLWNCRVFPRTARNQCMKDQVLPAMSPPDNAALPTPPEAAMPDNGTGL